MLRKLHIGVIVGLKHNTMWTVCLSCFLFCCLYSKSSSWTDRAGAHPSRKKYIFIRRNSCIIIFSIFSPLSGFASWGLAQHEETLAHIFTFATLLLYETSVVHNHVSVINIIIDMNERPNDLCNVLRESTRYKNYFVTLLPIKILAVHTL